MDAYRIADWTGDIRAVSWARRGRGARPHGVRLEHYGVDDRSPVWLETHQEQRTPRRLTHWLSRSRPDDLTHFCRRMLGHAVANLAINQTGGDPGAASRRLHDLLPEAERLHQGGVWMKVEVPAGATTAAFQVRGFEGLGWVAVADIGQHLVGAYSAGGAPTWSGWTLEIVAVPVAPV